MIKINNYVFVPNPHIAETSLYGHPDPSVAFLSHRTFGRRSKLLGGSTKISTMKSKTREVEERRMKEKTLRHEK